MASCPLVAELQFFTGTMDSGKSTLALQTNHNHAVRGRVGRIFTSHDRAGAATLSSRLGLQHEASLGAMRRTLRTSRRWIAAARTNSMSCSVMAHASASNGSGRRVTRTHGRARTLAPISGSSRKRS